MPVFDLKSWRDSLKSKYPNLSDDDLQFDELERGHMRQDKFSQRQQEYDRKEKANDEYADKLREAEQVILSRREKLGLMEKLERDFGPAENWSDALKSTIDTEHPGMNLSNQNIEEAIKKATEPLHAAINALKQETQNVGLGAGIMIDFMNFGPRYWEKTYGEEFPIEEFNKAFNHPENSVKNPRQFLQLFEQPAKTKKAKEDFDKAISDAEQRGEQRGASKGGAPYEQPGQKPGLFFTETGSPEIDPATGKPKQESQRSESPEEVKRRVGSAFFRAHDDYNRGKVGPGST